MLQRLTRSDSVGLLTSSVDGLQPLNPPLQFECTDMVELVDLLVPAGYRGVTSNMLFEWQKEQGANSMIWNEGESGDGRICFFDIPVAAVEYLRQRDIPCDTRPRDPLRPLPA